MENSPEIVMVNEIATVTNRGLCHKSPLSGAEKYPDFQVTSCLQNVSTNGDFAYIESE
jgi:hypothetical protein